MSTEQQQRTATPEVHKLWKDGLSWEMQFWGDWIQTRGLDWPDEFRARLDPECPFQPHLRPFLNVPADLTARVLDVGSGPLTKIGKKWDSRKIEIVAVDPLADDYNAALQRIGVTPLVTTRRGEAERLTDLFPHAFFDLVSAVNCIDHSYDAVAAIRQMLLVTRPGAFVDLGHSINEAETQKYTGLHQWNFAGENGRFIVWRPGVRIDVLDQVAELVGEARVNASDNWIAVQLRRK